MTRTTGHHEEGGRRDLRSRARTEDGHERSEEELAAGANYDAEDFDEDALEEQIREEIEEELQLGRNDEELADLAGASPFAEPPFPDDDHFVDVERQAGVRPTPKGPPSHQRLSARPEEMGARVLEGMTQTGPTDSEEARELLDDIPVDKELSIRGGEEEPSPEEPPARSPSSPTGSPPD